MQIWVLEVVINLGCMLELPGEVFTTPLSRLSSYQLNHIPWGWDPEISIFYVFQMSIKLRDTGLERSTESLVHALLMPKTHYLTSYLLLVTSDAHGGVWGPANGTQPQESQRASAFDCGLQSLPSSPLYFSCPYPLTYPKTKQNEAGQQMPRELSWRVGLSMSPVPQPSSWSEE